MNKIELKLISCFVRITNYGTFAGFATYFWGIIPMENKIYSFWMTREFIYFLIGVATLLLLITRRVKWGKQRNRHNWLCIFEQHRFTHFVLNRTNFEWLCRRLHRTTDTNFPESVCSRMSMTRKSICHINLHLILIA